MGSTRTYSVYRDLHVMDVTSALLGVIQVKDLKDQLIVTRFEILVVCIDYDSATVNRSYKSEPIFLV